MVKTFQHSNFVITKSVDDAPRTLFKNSYSKNKMLSEFFKNSNRHCRWLLLLISVTINFMVALKDLGFSVHRCLTKSGLRESTVAVFVFYFPKIMRPSCLLNAWNLYKLHRIMYVGFDHLKLKNDLMIYNFWTKFENSGLSWKLGNCT